MRSVVDARAAARHRGGGWRETRSAVGRARRARVDVAATTHRSGGERAPVVARFFSPRAIGARVRATASDRDGDGDAARSTTTTTRAEEGSRTSAPR
jgi:hypothetical protein